MGVGPGSDPVLQVLTRTLDSVCTRRLCICVTPCKPRPGRPLQGSSHHLRWEYFSMITSKFEWSFIIGVQLYWGSIYVSVLIAVQPMQPGPNPDNLVHLSQYAPCHRRNFRRDKSDYKELKFRNSTTHAHAHNSHVEPYLICRMQISSLF